MKKVDIEAIIEGLKELVRTAIIAVVPVLILQLQSGGNVDWRAIYVAGLVAVLSGLEKWSHSKDIKVLGDSGWVPLG